MNNGMTKTCLTKFSALFFSALLIYGAGNPSAVSAGPADTLTLTRVVDTDDLFDEDFFQRRPSGLSGRRLPARRQYPAQSQPGARRRPPHPGRAAKTGPG